MRVDELINENENKEYFAVSNWGNPYRVSDKEYFIVGPYTTSALAQKGAQRLLDNGQPERFRDWVSGSIKVVEKSKLKTTLTKLKLSMPESIKENDYDIGMVGLWRPVEL